MESVYENLKGSNTLVVAFQSHEDTVFGTTVGEFKRTLDSLNYDTVKINDKNGKIFFSGIDGTYDSHEKVLTLLSEYISGYTKTIFLGNCGGGHAAILFGTLLNVEKVIVFNPVTYMDQATLLLNNDGRHERLLFLDQSHPYINLKPYLESTNYNTQIHSIVAKNENRHLTQTNNISTCPNVNIEMINCVIPQVAIHLKRTNELVPKIVNIIES
jgi:hypothetical protein